VATGAVRCARCGGLIAPSEPFDLGHDDEARVRKTGGRMIGLYPEHQRCNRAAAADLTNGRVRYREEVEVPPEDPENRRWYGPNGEVWSRQWFEWR
jgi:hypothetical protein